MRMPAIAPRVAIVGASCVCVLALASAFDHDLALSLAVSITIGAGVGILFRAIVADLAGGLILKLDRTIKVGDYIEVNGAHGSLKRIGLRHTILVGDNNVLVPISNSILISKPVAKSPFGRTRMRFKISASRDSDPEEMRGLLLQIVAQQPDVCARPAPEVFLNAIGSAALAFELHAWTTTPHAIVAQLHDDLRAEIGSTLMLRGIDASIEDDSRALGSLQTVFGSEVLS
jgi:small-conductance mechanosensitive channel